MSPNDPYSCGMVWESPTCRRLVIQYLDGDEWALLGICRRASEGPHGVGSVGAFQHDKTGEWIFDQDGIREYLDGWKHIGVWDAHEYPRTVAESDALFTREQAELTHLRACETWILNHAQHGVACSYWTDYKPNDPKFKYTPKPCTCGLAKLMEEIRD